jgi:phosphatidylglycerol:prolipoprotein diacylglycerol transferase
MYPQLDLGPLTIYTYGLMLALGLAAGIAVLCAELRRKGLAPACGVWVALIAIPAGVVGSRLLFLVEERARFLVDPVGMTVASGGLSFYGGFLLATVAVYPYLKAKGIGFLTFSDAAAPGALLGRGIGRLGCHLSGDGDYGLPTALPWGTDYSSGVYPPSKALARLPDLAREFPGGVAPDDLPMHPTGVYEFVLATLVFVVVWRYRTRGRPDGGIFLLCLVGIGAIRFGLEFIALAPVVALGLTEAQLISLGLIAIGVVGLGYVRARPASLTPLTPTP